MVGIFTQHTTKSILVSWSFHVVLMLGKLEDAIVRRVGGIGDGQIGGCEYGVPQHIRPHAMKTSTIGY